MSCNCEGHWFGAVGLLVDGLHWLEPWLCRANGVSRDVQTAAASQREHEDAQQEAVVLEVDVVHQ